MKNFKFGKKFVAGMIAVSLVGGSFGAYHVHKTSEINRVKNYLTDFMTEDNFVDLSKISLDYKIKDFDGKYLKIALEEMDNIRYVVITDSYVFNENHVLPFTHKVAIDYDKYIWTDQDGVDYYEMTRPVLDNKNGELIYNYPDGYELIDVKDIANPIRYNELDSRKVEVNKDPYEDAYTLSMVLK